MYKIIIFLFCSVFSNLYTKAEVVLKGNVIGNTSKNVELLLPINYVTNEIKKATVYKNAIAPNGEFSLSFEIKRTCFITLSIDNEPIWLLLEPSDNLELIINLDITDKEKNDQWLKIKGNNAKGNLLFNKINYYPYNKFIPLFNFLENLPFDKNFLVEKIDSIIKATSLPFQELYRKNDISANFFNIINKTIAANFLTQTVKDFNTGKSYITKTYSKKDRDSILEKLFLLIDPMDPDLLCALNSSYYAYGYFVFKHFKNTEFSYDGELKDSLINYENRSYKISKTFVPFLGFKSKAVVENYWANILLNLQKLFPRALSKDDIDFFKLLYPNSQYNAYFKKPVMPLQDSILAKIYILDSLGTTNSLAELKQKLPNKKYFFIDIWATWCIPCRAEFVNNQYIDSFFTRMNIEHLYISIDEISSRQIWKEVLYDNNLKGYHILASLKFKQLLAKELYAKGEPFSIPRYFLIDNNAVILNKDLLRPSDKEKLIHQISELLKVKEP